MNDAFLPGNGFDTYEEQDRVLMGLSGSVRSGVAVRILQQQGFAVAAAVVRLADTPEEHAAVDAAKALAKKLDVECVTLNAEALAGQDAEAARFAALLGRQAAKQPDLPLRVLGPTPGSIEKINDFYRYKLTVKCRNDRRFRDLIRETLTLYEQEKLPSKATVVVDLHSDGDI